jgi:hypothetical protein
MHDTGGSQFARDPQWMAEAGKSATTAFALLELADQTGAIVVLLLAARVGQDVK